MATPKFPISQELIDTVKKHDGKTKGGRFPLVEEVFFDKEGNHYFNTMKIKVFTPDGKGNAKENVNDAKEVTCLPGAKREVIKVLQGDGKTWKDSLVFVGYEKVADTVSREDILAATPASQAKAEDEQKKTVENFMLLANSGKLDEVLAKMGLSKPEAPKK